MKLLSSLDRQAALFIQKAYGKQVGSQLLEVSQRLPSELERARYIRSLVKDARVYLDTGEASKKYVQEFYRYREDPVDVETFLHHPYYLDKAGSVYPEVLREMKEINSGKYVEVVLTGGIGSAKSTTALYTQTYQLYLLSLMRDPHGAFGLDSSTEIVCVFQSINARLAKAVDYNRFRHMIEGCAYFRERFPFNDNLESKLVFPRRIEVVPVSGQETAAIGQNVISGIIDELNYMAVVEKSKQSVEGGTYDQAVAIYNSIARRRKSRFMSAGTMPGILCLVSSRRYPGQFTDTKEEEAKTDPTIYVYDKCVWDVKPDAYAGSSWFKVFVGDESRKPRIMEGGEVLPECDQGLEKLVPEDFRHDFEKDIINALREIAGVSTLARFPFITNPESVSKSMGKVKNLFSRDSTDFVTSQLELILDHVKDFSIPRYTHIDLGVTSDNAGLCIGHVPGFAKVNMDDDEGVFEQMPLIHIDGIMNVAPPQNGEILFFKIRRILYLLRDMGLNLRWVTLDTYQSIDTLQTLRQKGFITGVTSMDTSTEPYDYTKAAFYEGRILMPLHERTRRELVSLEKDQKRNKVDHPANGSKDCSDALAGVVYGLTMRREVWSMYGVKPTAIMMQRQQAKDQQLKSRDKE